MIDRLRELLDRPINDAERRRLFALAVSVVVGAGLLLVLSGRPSGEDATSSTTTAASPAAPSPTPPAGRAPTGTTPERAPGQAEVAASARRFLDGYLAYLYGRGPARAIRDAIPALLRRLERERPRVSPAARRRRGRVVDLTARRAGGGRYAVTATIADGGVARYPIALTIERRGGRWLVVEVGGE